MNAETNTANFGVLHRPTNRRSTSLAAKLCLFILASSFVAGQIAAKAPSAPPDLSTILERMAAHNRMRDKFLTTYSVDREYEIENKRVNKKAALTATMIFVAPEEKLFETTSFSGSGFLRKMVLNRLMETEKQTAQGVSRLNSAISTDNYSFEFVREDLCEGRLMYVLRATPKKKSEVLFEGLIWVDGEDFAVTRVEGRPAKNPSFWIKKISFEHQYAKFGDFWFPVKNTSVTSVRIFGDTTAEITYKNYIINEPSLHEKAALMRNNLVKLETQMPPTDEKYGGR
jgi:outer membrane lipoprotein-sorting protein